MIQMKRVYEKPAKDDGVRILVDRLWPRGMSKATARIDIWAKEVAPSDALRKWFGHEPERWGEFRKRYAAELKDPVRQEALTKICTLARRRRVTLLFGARDEKHCNAAVLVSLFRRRRPGR